jgi:RimJ/RimL family protein N-acetyltransferase
MTADLFTGQLVRLGSEDPQALASAFSRWNRDPVYFRLLDTDPARLWSANRIKEWLEKDSESPAPGNILCSIRTLADDRLIGFIAFEEINWASRDAYVAIGIGERDCWGKGCGTDAMRLMLQYGFGELNLHRVSLTVFEYNPRAIRSYEKCGFQHEGRIRQFILRDGKRWDMLHMGLLRAEWLALPGKEIGGKNENKPG